MNNDQEPQLIVHSDIDSFTVECLSPATAPTVNVNAGDVIVEIDVTRPHAPVTVVVHSPETSEASLNDLFGATTAERLLNIANTSGEHEKAKLSPTEKPLVFTPGPGWNGLVTAAFQEWNLYWNPLPLDRSLSALDSVVAGRVNLDFDGKLTAKRYASEALPAGRALQHLLGEDQVTETAAPLVRNALDALKQTLGLEDLGPEAETGYALPPSLTDTSLHALLDGSPDTTIDDDVLLTGSPDWRLTGHGPATTAEDSIHVHQHPKNEQAISVTVPLQSVEHPPSYDAIITEPNTGEIIAHTTLKPAGGNILRGHTFPIRPIRATDHIDIRHSELSGHPERDPQQRIVNRQKRDAARQYVAHRLGNTAGRSFPGVTLSELSQTGHLLKTGIQQSTQSFARVLSQADYALAASARSAEAAHLKGHSDRHDFEEFAAVWWIPEHGSTLTIILEPKRHRYPAFSLVTVHIGTHDEHSTYYMLLYSNDEGTLTSELREIPLPTDFVLEVSPSLLQIEDLPAERSVDVTRSIHACNAEGFQAWKLLAGQISPTAPLAGMLRNFFGGGV